MVFFPTGLFSYHGMLSAIGASRLGLYEHPVKHLTTGFVHQFFSTFVEG